MHCHNGYYVTRETHFATFHSCMFMIGLGCMLAVSAAYAALVINCGSNYDKS